MYFRKNIKLLRKNAKFTQLELAEAIGLKSNTIIGKYEDGKATPPIETLEQIATLFKVPLVDLMFTDLEAGTKAESRVGDKDRITRLLEKELDRLEALEKEIKETPGALEALRKIAPELVKKIEES